MKTIKKSYGFSTIQIVVLGFFALLSLLFFIDKRPYREELEDNLSPAAFSFLQKGDYTLEVTYEDSPEENCILVYTNDMINEKNQVGIVYSQHSIPSGSGVVQLSLSLEQPSYQICVGTLCDQKDKGFLTKVILQSNHLIHKDNYILCVIFLLAGIVSAFLFRKAASQGTENSALGILGYPVTCQLPLILLAMGLLASLPLFSDALLWGDDTSYHLARLEGIYQGLASGDFPVRITPQQMSGYGGLTATMYPQLFLYPVALLRFFGVSVMLCYKILVVSMNIATSALSYYAAKSICKSHKAALWMSIFYTFSVYRLCNIYVRGALGESLAMVFLPLVLMGTYEVLWGNHRKWMLLSLGMTGILGSHLLSVQMCVLFMGVEFIFWLFCHKKVCDKENTFGKRFLSGCKAVGVTVLLNASFLVPFLYFCGQNLQCFSLPFEVADSVAYFSQMFTFFPSIQGASLPPGTTAEEMPITLGGVLLLGSILFLLLLGKHGRQWESIGLHCLIYGGLAVFLSSWLFPWGKIAEVEILRKICSSLQFSWRFLGPATAFWSLTSAIGIVGLTQYPKELAQETEQSPKKSAQKLEQCLAESAQKNWSLDYRLICAVMAVLVILSTSSLFDRLSQQRIQYSDKMELDGSDLADGMYAYLDSEKFRPIQLDYHRSGAYLNTSGGTPIECTGYHKEGSHISVEVTPLAQGTDYLMFPLYWFPGYEIVVNGEKVPVLPVDTLVSCQVPLEKASIQVRYVGFWFFQVADLITAATFGTILGWSIYQARKYRAWKYQAGKATALSGKNHSCPRKN